MDAYFPKDARASAQGLFNVMILGGGALLANSLCPYLGQKVFTHDGVTNFHGLFLVAMFCALIAVGGAGLVLSSAEKRDAVECRALSFPKLGA